MATPNVAKSTVQNPVASKNGSGALVSNGHLDAAFVAPKNPANGVKAAGCGDIKPAATPTPAQPCASIVDVASKLGSYPADVSPMSNKK